MYDFLVVETVEFLSGNLVGLTVEQKFPICSSADYDATTEVGKVRTSCTSKRTIYRVVSAKVVPMIGGAA